MAIELNNLIFVHCPKTGGKFITKCLLESVKDCNQIGHPVWDGHLRYSLYSKMTFGYLRHPISFLESLWSHRKRKKNYDTKKFNWQDHVRLERICQSDDFHEFLINVSNHTDIVWDFYMYYLGGHRQMRLLKFENLLPSLIDILDEFNVKYDEKKIMEVNNHEATRTKEKIPEELQKKILESEKILSKNFGYDFFI